jgi:hypothetical protein
MGDNVFVKTIGSALLLGTGLVAIAITIAILWDGISVGLWGESPAGLKYCQTREGSPNGLEDLPMATLMSLTTSLAWMRASSSISGGMASLLLSIEMFAALEAKAKYPAIASWMITKTL